MHRTLKLTLGVAALLSLLTGASPAEAAILTQTQDPFTLTETSCSGENVTFTGYVHWVHRLTTSATGTQIEGLTLNSVSAQGVSASGVKYVLRDGSNTQSRNAYLPGPGAQEFTATIRLREIRQGESVPFDDLYFTQVAHFTINANGVTTVSFPEASSDFVCR